MKKIILTLAMILVFSMASAQTNTQRSKSGKSKRQTEYAKKTDTRTIAQKKQDAERNINLLEDNTTLRTPPASAPGNVNTNSSAMPQVTPVVTTPPPGAPLTSPEVGTPVFKPSNP